jgi:hypothetical protein
LQNIINEFIKEILKMRKNYRLYLGILFVCICIMASLIIVSAEVAGDPEIYIEKYKEIDNKISNVIEYELLANNCNELKTDEDKITKIIDLYTMAKWENYENSKFNIDFACFFSSIADTNVNIDYTVNKWEMLSQRRQQLNINIIWSKVYNTINQIIIKGDTASVVVREKYSSITDDTSETTAEVVYDITYTFVKEKNIWKISYIYSDDEFDKLYFNETINVEQWLDKLNQSIDLGSEEIDVNSSMYERIFRDLELEKEFLEKSIGWHAIYFTRSNANTYASTYYSNSNSKFYDYTGQGGDCANFGSQCLWYAFGGTNTTAAIEGKYLPMMYNTIDDRDWFQCDGYGECDGDYYWINTNNFASYLDISFEHSGLRGWYNDDAEFGYCALADIIQLEDTSETGDYIHTYIVNAVNGIYGSRTRSNIWVSAHTTDRYNCNLGTHADLSGIPDSRLRVLSICGCLYYGE